VRPWAPYTRFHKAYAKSSDKEVKVMFHGTSAGAAVNICRKARRTAEGGGCYDCLCLCL
jgi:hypothetical protein